jgi:NAD-dependent deacetylase
LKLTKKKIVVLSGAGMSAESGISTFRDKNGLWENHSIEDVASREGWARNPELVLHFYNDRRRQLHHVQPNKGHLILAELESTYDVQIITQNVDNLHEMAGSSKIMHLHGELFKACNQDKSEIIEWTGDIALGQLASDRTQLRPFIVWFGEEVPEMYAAEEATKTADILIVIGTSLQVYPAAGLIHAARSAAQKYIVDPNCIHYNVPGGFEKLPMTATEGMRIVKEKLANL